MKRLLVFLLLVSSLPGFSQNVTLRGGEIWYDFIGDSLSPYKYRVWLQLYRDTGTAPAPVSPMLCITSSCSIDTSVLFSKQPFQLQPGSDSTYGSAGSVILPFANECVNTSRVTEVHRYSVDVDLTDSCSFTFIFTGGSRGFADNLAVQGENLHLEATVTNFFFDANSSPRFLSPIMDAYCSGTTTVESQAVSDPDNDSLWVQWDFPSTSSSVCPPIPTQVVYDSTYYDTLPYPTNFGFSHYPKYWRFFRYGTFEFTPQSPGRFVVKIRTTDLRRHTITGFYFGIGHSEREMIIDVQSSCPSSKKVFSLHSLDTTNSISTVFHCGDSILDLTASSRILCTSIAADGSDFLLFNSQGDTLPVVAAGADNCTDLYSKNFWVKLSDTLSYNDTLQLVVRTGTDTNTLENVCGYQLPPNDSTEFHVLDCNTWVNREELVTPQIHLFPNPAKDQLQVEIPDADSGGKLWITDLSGRVVLKVQEVKPENILDLKNLASGSYLLQYRTAEGFVKTFKFLKQ